MTNPGQDIHALAAELYPICRSITGSGVRKTLSRLEKLIPLTRHEIPSGTSVLDWTVPKEWNVREAYIQDLQGKRLIDFQNCNLHVLNYSMPVRKRMTRAELASHVYTLPDQPDLIPYRTSYYSPNWGFCLSQKQWDAIPEGEYQVCIESSLEDGAMTLAECVVQGRTDEEVLISSHICHPALANDNLSGVCVATYLAKSLLASPPLRYTYRFLFVPGTIGSITWLSLNRHLLGRIRHGLVLSCIGDAGHFNYKKSRQGNAEIDRAMIHLLQRSGEPYGLHEFTPYGYDERQYCSPGFNLPVGCMMRSVHGTFPEYHTSADNPGFLKPESLAGSLRFLESVVELLDNNLTYVNQAPYGEPQLGKRGLYRATGGNGIADANMAKLWILNLSDGYHSLLDIAGRSNIPFPLLAESARELECAGLLRTASSEHSLVFRTAS